MTMRQSIGAAMLAVPLLGLFIFGCIGVGVMRMAIITAGSLAFSGLIMGGIFLLRDDR